MDTLLVWLVLIAPFIFFCLVFALFFAFFVALWLFVIWVLAQAGWKKLAEVYPSLDPVAGPRWRFQTARLGASYKGALNVRANVWGVQFVPMFLFRFAHPPIFIPWSDITGAERTEAAILRVELYFANLPSIIGCITVQLADNLEIAAEGAWQYERV